MLDWVVLTLVSLVTAAVMLLVVRATSDQPRLARVKRSIRAGLFEIRLFNDDGRAILRAQRDIVRHNAEYLRLSLVPLLWLLAPLALLTAQLQFFYGYDGLETGRTAIVKARVGAGWPGDGSRLALEAPPGLRVDTSAVWIPSLGEAAWRIVAERAGRYELTVRVEGQAPREILKMVDVSDGMGRRSPVRLRGGILNRLLFSAEPPLPAESGLESIEVSYAARWLDLAGFRVHWLVAFAALTMAFALLLKGRFRVIL